MLLLALLLILIAGVFAPTAAADTAAQLEAQINGTPAGATLQLPAEDHYISESIDIDAHGQAVFANGARFIATTHGFSVFRIRGGNGLWLQDATAIGANQAHKAARPPGADQWDQTSATSWEWDHGFEVAGATDIVLAGVRAYDVWGDGVAVQYAALDVPSRYVQIIPSATRNPEFRHVGRNGVSFISAVHSRLEGAEISDIHGLWSIDIEPDNHEQVLHHVTIARNRIGGSLGAPITLQGPYHATAVGNVFAHLRIVDNVVYEKSGAWGNGRSISVGPSMGHSLAGLEITGNRLVEGIYVANAYNGTVAHNIICPAGSVDLDNTSNVTAFDNGCSCNCAAATAAVAPSLAPVAAPAPAPPTTATPTPTTATTHPARRCHRYLGHCCRYYLRRWRQTHSRRALRRYRICVRRARRTQAAARAGLG